MVSIIRAATGKTASMVNDLGLLRSVAGLLDEAGFEVAVFGGWAEELSGLRAPGHHRDVDLVVIDAPLDRLDQFLDAHAEIPAKRLPHMRAFLVEGVAVELFLGHRTPQGVELRWWDDRPLPLYEFATRQIKGLPVVSATALTAYRRHRPGRPDGLWDHDFHPDEPDVRIFVVPPQGVLRRDDSLVVTEARYGEHVLRHYAFGDRWFKINVTTDLEGRPTVYGEDGFTFNCDIATPMVRDQAGVYAVDLFLDVLVDVTGRSCKVVDRDEFGRAVRHGMVSEREASCAEEHLAFLLTMVRAGELLPWLNTLCPFSPSTAPAALPIVRGPVMPWVARATRPSW